MLDEVLVASFPAMPELLAGQLMEALEAAFEPEPCAVSMNETDEALKLWAVQAYYQGALEREALARVAAPVLAEAGFSVADLTIAPVGDTNWVEESLKGLAPVVAGRFYVHGSHDRATRRRHGVVAVQIDAGTAFGTGHHGTTRGCLLALDAILKQRRPRGILDVGCGTGVLGIAAALATHGSCMLSDIDSEAVRVSLRNARNNRAAGLVKCVTAAGVRHVEIAGRAPYDLVFANILARPLVALAPAITTLCGRAGDIVLSGLTVDQERRVLAAYRACGAVLHKRIRQAEWSTLWLKNRCGLACASYTTKKRPAGRRTGRFLLTTSGLGQRRV
jgi:ribosomal protein L11 methyltransferase